jgi:toxin ParE1/3/4
MDNMTKQVSYRLTADAQTDLVEIRSYTIQQWGTQQSKKYISELRQKIQFIAASPEIGRRHLDIGDNVFSFPYASHMIYYFLIGQQLIVFGILHQSMVPMTHLDDRDMY